MPGKPHCRERARKTTTPVRRLALIEALLAALAVTLLEASHAAAGIQNLLLAGVERVAVRAHVNRHMIASGGGTGDERVASRAGDLHGVIIGMNTLLHGVSPMEFGGPGSPAPMAGVNRNRQYCTRHYGRHANEPKA